MKKHLIFFCLAFGHSTSILAQQDTNYHYTGAAGSAITPPTPVPQSNIWNNYENWIDDYNNYPLYANGCYGCNYTIGDNSYPDPVQGFFTNPVLILTDNLQAAFIQNEHTTLLEVNNLSSGYSLTLAPSPQTTSSYGNLVGNWQIDIPLVLSSSYIQYPFIVNGNSKLTQNSSLTLSGHDLTLNSLWSLNNSSILTTEFPITFDSENTLTFVFSGDYLTSGTIALSINSSGAISSSQCLSMICSSNGNLTYDIYLPNEGNNLSIAIDATAAKLSAAANNIQIADFPNGFGSYESLHRGNFGCCYNSPGLNTTSDNFSTGAVSMFDPVANPNATFKIIDNPKSQYVIGWANFTPYDYNQLKGLDRYNQSQTGYQRQFDNGFLTYNYGVNGVFGLWVDVLNKHHTAAHTAGTNSPNNTATMLNTIKKSNQMQLRSELSLDNEEALIPTETVAINNELISVDDLIAQQSMVQQLAERNLQTPVKHWSVYVEPKGSWGQIFKQKKHLGNTFQTAGTRAGFDYLWTNEKNQIPVCVGLGFVGDYLHLWGQRKHHSGNFSANEGLGNAYITVIPKAVRELSFNLIAGGGYSWYTFHRDLFENSKVIATGKSSGPEADLFLEIEYVFRHKRFSAIPKDFRIAPIAALQYTYSKINAYKETGAGRYNLKVNDQDASTLSTLLGFRTNYEFRSGSDVSVRPELMLLWQYQYLDPSITSTASYLVSDLGPDLITATLPGLSRNTLIVGADLRVNIYDCAEVQLDYDLLYNSAFITNVFFLELKGKF